MQTREQKTDVERPDEVVAVCSALANRKRLQILSDIENHGPSTLQEVHERTRKTTGISHRETTYSYTEILVDAGLLSVETDSDGHKRYLAPSTCVRLSLVEER